MGWYKIMVPFSGSAAEPPDNIFYKFKKKCFLWIFLQ